MPYFNLDSEKYDFDIDLTSEDIKEYFRLYPPKPGVNLFEMGIDLCRFDLIHINPSARYVRIFEIKVNRSDFLGDDKWQNYLRFCHTFSFVCPHGLIRKDEVPKGIGLLWIYRWKWKDDAAWSKEPIWRYDRQWARRPKRCKIGTETLTRLAFTMLYRVLYRKDDIF